MELRLDEKRSRFFLKSLLIMTSAVLLVGCNATVSGPKKLNDPVGFPRTSTSKNDKLTPVTFQLNFAPGGFNAGFALALQQGYYKHEGLDVTIVPGNGSLTTAQLVATGHDYLAYADAIPIMQLIAKGAPMKIVSTIYQSNPNEVTALASSGIRSIADLKGKSIGVPTGGSQVAMIPLLLQSNGLKPSDVKLVNLSSTAMVPALVQHKVDAILGSLDFYGIQLQQLGAKTVNFPFYNHGVATVSTSIFASNAYLKAHGDIVKKFVSASLRGWSEAFKHPHEAIDALVKTFPTMNINKSQALLQLQATKTLATANTKYIGKASPTAWAETQKLLSQVGILPKGVNPTKYYTYAYLPATLPPAQ
ncbi:MAG: ABC transporter substrate-binding protein [Alicyclobacillus sp.]|nr:ABC transporter substrate-binding protein [Alicyclobacillus sp.]